MNRADKLALNRETVRRLTDTELEWAQGGHDPDPAGLTMQCLTGDTCVCLSDDDAWGDE